MPKAAPRLRIHLTSFVVIPARLASSRLPRKLLLGETGKPLVQHTYEAAQRAERPLGLCVAADHEDIAAAVRSFGGQVQMTSPDCASGTDRVAEIAAAMNDVGDLFDIVTVHWYADGPGLEFMMDQLVRPASLGKNVWLSEVGMKPCFSFFGEAGQALLYEKVLSAFQARRDWWTGVNFYDLYEVPTASDCGTAITRPDWSNRPAFLLYQAFIRASP